LYFVVKGKQAGGCEKKTEALEEPGFDLRIVPRLTGDGQGMKKKKEHAEVV